MDLDGNIPASPASAAMMSDVKGWEVYEQITRQNVEAT